MDNAKGILLWSAPGRRSERGPQVLIPYTDSKRSLRRRPQLLRLPDVIYPLTKLPIFTVFIRTQSELAGCRENQSASLSWWALVPLRYSRTRGGNNRHRQQVSTTNGSCTPTMSTCWPKSGITPQFAALRGYETVVNATCLKPGSCQGRPDTVPGLDVSVAGRRWNLAGGLAIPPRQPSTTQWQASEIRDARGPVQRHRRTARCRRMARRSRHRPLDHRRHQESRLRRGPLNCASSPNGVWGWLGTDAFCGKTALPDWRDVALNGRRVILVFDSDVSRKHQASKALRGFADWLKIKGAHVEYLHLPDNGYDKVGLDDHPVNGHTTADLERLVQISRQEMTGDPRRTDETGPNSRTPTSASTSPKGILVSGSDTPAVWDGCTSTRQVGPARANPS